MGVSTNAMLFYGYDLGEDFTFEGNEPDWYNEEEGWIESAERALLAGVGFTETAWRADGYYDRLKEAKAKVGVELDTHCSDECSMYLIAVKVQTVRRGWVEEPDMTLPENADERLAWALETLGLKPEHDKPRWLLASYWG